MCFHQSGNILSAANASGLLVTMDNLAWGFMLGEETHPACFSYCLLAEASFRAIQFLALAVAAESLGLSSISTIAFKWEKGRCVGVLYKLFVWVTWQCSTRFREVA